MKKLSLLTALAVTIVLAVPALAQEGPPGQREEGPPGQQRDGVFIMDVYTHSEYGSPGGADLKWEANALEYDFDEGDSFAYSSIVCDHPAPHNDEALRINPRYPGIDKPAAVRHHVTGTVTSYDGRRGTIAGEITTSHCEEVGDGDEEGQQGGEISFTYQARFQEAGDDLRVTHGTWTITGGTEQFEGLRGEGRLTGRLTCLPLVLEDHGADSCEELGAYSDLIYRLRGHWWNPTL